MTFKSTPALAMSVLLYAASGASAQTLSLNLTGSTWTLVSGSENYPDGKKNMPWATGMLMLSASGHISVFLVGKDQPSTSPSVRTPVGPFVAYYGQYTIDNATNTVTYKVEQAGSPVQKGTTRTQKVTFNGAIMTWTGSEIKTPEGVMTPVNEWKRAQ